MKDGRVTTGPSAGSPDVVGPVRDAVETTKLVKIVRENNDDNLLLVVHTQSNDRSHQS